MTPGDGGDDPDLAYYDGMLDALRDRIAGAAWRETMLARVIDSEAAAAVAGAAEHPTPDGAFPYVPLGLSEFLEGLRMLDGLLAADPDHASADARYRPVRFVEVGCGIGRNIHILRQATPILWSRLAGFDISSELVAAGQVRYGLAEELFVADARSYDFSGDDVIFSYRPFADDLAQRAYEAHVRRSMKPGAYLFAPLALDREKMPAFIARGESGDIWKKIA